LSDTNIVTGAEFIRKVEGYAKRTGRKVSFVPQRGKGSHGTLYLDEKLTIVRNKKDELKKGALHGMLRQLGIRAEDLS
jgi:hypothetical protein